MSRRADLIWIIVGAALAACGSKIDHGGRYKLRVGGVPPGTTVLVSGVPVGVLGKDLALEITLPKGVFLNDGKGAVAVRLDTPCGPKDVALPSKSPVDLDAEKSQRTMDKAIYSSVVLPPEFVSHTFWVDRTGAPKAKVTIGSLELRPEMERYRRFELLWPTCADGHIVRVDGTEVGKLPADAPVEQELVIATAPTCYRLREIAFTAGTYGKGDDDQLIARTQMVWTKPLHYFLERAPDEISSSDVSEMRHELMAIDCPKGT
jgi:hypothetical protein